MGEIAVRADRLSKLYKLGGRQRHHDTLRERIAHGLTGLVRRRPSDGSERPTVWALKDVSFEVRRGEVVGIIGSNGAGKSTLLKILSRITEPTMGSAEVSGRVGSLLEVGTGFHPELTGWENIFLSGVILGMKKREIHQKLDEIVAFAGIEKFLDTPVKHYSSGMYLRLAFAVAAHLEPEILFVDEVLAVGDAEFQKRCLGKMQDVAREGRTVLFVSHNLASIGQLCERALWIHDGRLNQDGPATEIIASYLSATSANRLIWSNPSKKHSTYLAFEYARVVSASDQPAAVVEFSSEFRIEIAYKVLQRVRDLAIIFRVIDPQGNVIWTSWNTDLTGWRNGKITDPGTYLSICKVPARMLRPKLYHVSVGARSDEHGELHENVLAFEVSGVGFTLNPGRPGLIAPLLEWEVRQLNKDQVRPPGTPAGGATVQTRAESGR